MSFIREGVEPPVEPVLLLGLRVCFIVHPGGAVLNFEEKWEEKDLEEKKKAALLTREEEHLQQEILRILGIYRDLAKEEEARGEGKEEIFRKVKEAFQDQAGEREELIKDIGEKLQNTFDFLEMAFAEGQELVVFVTELNTNPYSMEFISENGCDSYYKYNKKLLFDQEQREILEELENIEEEL